MMEYLTPSVTGISRFILVILLFTLPIPTFFGGLGTQVHKRCSAIFFLWLALGYLSPSHLNFLKPPHPMTQSGGNTKRQEAAIQGLHPQFCHQVTHVSLGSRSVERPNHQGKGR